MTREAKIITSMVGILVGVCVVLAFQTRRSQATRPAPEGRSGGISGFHKREGQAENPALRGGPEPLQARPENTGAEGLSPFRPGGGPWPGAAEPSAGMPPQPWPEPPEGNVPLGERPPRLQADLPASAGPPSADLHSEEREKLAPLIQGLRKELREKQSQGYDVQPVMERLRQLQEAVRAGDREAAKKRFEEARTALKEAQKLDRPPVRPLQEFAQRPPGEWGLGPGFFPTPQAKPQASQPRVKGPPVRPAQAPREAQHPRSPVQRKEPPGFPPAPVGAGWGGSPHPLAPPASPEEKEEKKAEPRGEQSRPSGESDWLREPVLENSRVRVYFDGQHGRLALYDRVTQRTWTQVVGDPAITVERVEPAPEASLIEASLLGPVPCRALISLPQPDQANLCVRIVPQDLWSAEENPQIVLAYPHPFVVPAGGYLALPLKGRERFAAGRGWTGPEWLRLGADWAVPWFGVADEKGSFIGVVETPTGWTGALHAFQPPGLDQTCLQPSWRYVDGSLERELGITYHFSSATGYRRLQQAYEEVCKVSAARSAEKTVDKTIQ